MNEKLSSKFPSVLREALEKGIVSFPDDVLEHYDSFKAYRVIRRKKSEPILPLKNEDFYSQMEKYKNNSSIRNVGNNSKKIDETNIGNYSCSFFTSGDRLNEAMSLPRRNTRVIYGRIKQEYGFVRKNKETSHVDLWIFDGLQINKFDFEEVSNYESE